MNEQEIFTAALEQEANHRAAFLGAACGTDNELRRRIDDLLQRHDQAGAFFEKPAAEILATAQLSPTPERPGTPIGRYKLLEQVGEGGMGIVFVAEQTEPVRRRVALKIIKPGMDTKQVIARFEAERQALAMMDHPNIARVLDAGTTDAGRPYFVMELVRGMPITEYCDKARLSPRQRLELFVDVCQAVQHAHQKGIIHRDLKPSNVMITLHDGTPVVKVIDFGVAKAVGQQLTERTIYTALTQLVGTPLYMSPEQAEMSGLDVDTRSDVYSLGVLLYELLTGQTPFAKETLSKAGLDEMRRIIREDEPLRPSRRFSTLGAQAISTVSQHRSLDERRLSKILCGELDWIVMKALEKDRSRRYESASALATDIQRYLSDEPVLACPPTTMYRFQKFARKHKPALGTAAAIAACLILGTTVSAWQATRASTAEAQANANASQAQTSAQEAKAKAQEASAQRNEAQQQRDEAQKQRDEVKALADKLVAKEQQLLRTLYAANMKLAKVAWDDAAVHQVQELLKLHRPNSGEQDLRAFEWHYLNRLCHSEILTFKGHGAWVSDAAFSPDGKRVASAGGEANNPESSIKVWDSATGQELLTIRQVGRSSVAFSPDGKLLASTSRDGTVKILDSATGQERLVLKGHTGFVESLAFSPDGKRLGSASYGLDAQNRYLNAQLKIWDVESGQELLNIDGVFRHFAFSPDGKRLASTDDSTTKIWDAQSGRELLSITGGRYRVAFSPDGKRLARAGIGYVKVCDSQTGEELLAFENNARQLAYSPDGKRLATAGGNRIVTICDSQTGQQLFTFQGHANIVNGLAFNSDGTRLASTSLDGTVKIWNATTSPEARTLGEIRGNARGLFFSPDGRRLVGNVRTQNDQYSSIKIWEVQTGRQLLAFQPKTGDSFRQVIISPDGARIAAGVATWDATETYYATGHVIVWDAQTGRELITFKAHDADLNSLAFSPDGKRLATGSSRPWDQSKKYYGVGEAKLWDAQSGQELISITGHTDQIIDLAFSPDGLRVASQSRDGIIKMSEVQTGQLILTIKVDRQFQGNGCLAFSPDGKRLASSSRASGSSFGPAGLSEVKVFDAQTGQELLALKGHTATVSCIVYSRDGKRLASASGSPARTGPDGEVKVWDAETGQDLLTLKGGVFGHRVAYSSDGHQLASDAGGAVKIYDATPLPEKP